MKKSFTKGLPILIGYCVPFTFLAMYGDVTHDSMWLYGLLILGMGLLCWYAVRIRSLWGLLGGNLLSLLTSYFCITQFQTADWQWYFKPFRAETLELLISFVITVVQLIIWLLAVRKIRK